MLYSPSHGLHKFEEYQTNTSQYNANYSSTNLSNLHRPEQESDANQLPSTSNYADSPSALSPTNLNIPMKDGRDFFLAKEKLRSSRWYGKYLLHVNIKVTALCACWYLVSMISSNTTKFILKEYPFPITLTQFQFFFNFSFCIMTLLIMMFLQKHSSLQGLISSAFPIGFMPDLDKLQSIRHFAKPSGSILSTTVMMGFFQSIGHITSHKATSLIPVSIVHTVKALAPLVIVLIKRIFFRSKYKLVTYLTLIPLICGIMLSCNDPKHAQSRLPYYKKGLVYALISMLIFVVQNITSKKVLTVDDRTKRLPLANDRKLKKFDKMTILFFCSLIGFAFAMPLYLYLEIQNENFSLTQLTPYIFVLMVINGLSHFLQSLIAFQILGMISSVNYSIANLMKRVVIILVAFLIERQDITRNQTYGLILTLFGLYAYETWGQK